MEVLKKQTQSLCNICKRQIKASVFIRDDKVFIQKRCDEHGQFEFPVEVDPSFYKRISHIKDCPARDFHMLLVPATYKCNLNCKFCYIPVRDKKDLSFEEIKKMIDIFKGDIVSLTGGEPTLRSDLPQIISYIRSRGLTVAIVTNGLLLEDIDYLKTLKDAGLNYVSISVDSFEPGFYELMKDSEGALSKRLKALENLKKLRMDTVISATLFRGINDSEIKNLLSYCLDNSDFIIQFRVRSSTKIGRYLDKIDSFYLSEILKKIQESTGLNCFTGFDNYLVRYVFNNIYNVDLRAYFLKVKGKIIPLPFLSRVINALVYFAFRISKKFGQEKLFKKYSTKRVITKYGFISQLSINIWSWPTLENIDLGELHGGVAHVYEGKLLNGLQAVALNEGL